MIKLPCIAPLIGYAGIVYPDVDTSEMPDSLVIELRNAFMSADISGNADSMFVEALKSGHSLTGAFRGCPIQQDIALTLKKTKCKAQPYAPGAASNNNCFSHNSSIGVMSCQMNTA